jgi:hypothetical protein
LQFLQGRRGIAMMNGPGEILCPGHSFCQKLPVQMQMLNGLAAFVTGIDDDTITPVQLMGASEVRGSHHQMAQERLMFLHCLCL